MLKCVVFPVTAYGYQVISAGRAQMEKPLAENGVTLYAFEAGTAEEKDDFRKKINGSRFETLFVTDDPELLKKLLAGDCYAIAFYHEKNKEVFFRGALYAVEDVAQLTYHSCDEAYRRLAGIPWDILETDRLKVRESTVEDVEDFYRIYADPSITFYMEDLFQDPDEERVYMETYIKQFYGFYGFGMWTVILKETGQIIGRAGLSIREGYDLPELGFMIAVPFQKKGLAFEVCSAVLKYAREELFFDEVQALVEKENTASLRVLEKLGFYFRDEVTEKGKRYRLMIKENKA